MAYITSSRNQSNIELSYSASSTNSVAAANALFTNEAHLHSAYPNHDYIDRAYWNAHTVALNLDVAGVPALTAFKAKVFISLDAKIWFTYSQLDAVGYTTIDIPFRYLKIVRDNTSAGDVRAVICSEVRHIA